MKKCDEHPVSSPERDKRGKHAEEAEMSAIVPIAGMPDWALVMQQTLMDHTTKQMAGLRVDVDEALARSIETQDQVRALKKEFDELKSARASSPSIRSLEVLETEFKEFKSRVNQQPHFQAKPSPIPSGSDTEKRSRTVNFGVFPKDTKADEIKEFISNIMKDVKDVEDFLRMGKSLLSGVASDL